MTDNRDNESGRGMPWRMIGWGGVGLLLLLPLVIGAPWTMFDYVFAGAVLGGAGLALELLARASGNLFYRSGAAVGLLTAVMLVVVNGAVGFLANEDNPANLMFLGVIAVAVVGAFIANFKASGMARAMFAAAAAQLAAGAIGLAGGFASPGAEGLYEVVMGTFLFGGLWLLAGWLFRRAAGDEIGTQAV